MVFSLARRLRGARRHLSGGLVVGLGVINLAVGFITAVVLANLLTKNGYGAYAYGVGISTIALMPVELGLPTLMMREVARMRAADDLRRIGALLAFGLALVSFTLAAVWLVFWLIIPAVSSSEELAPDVLLWSLVLIAPLALMNWARALVLGFDKPIAFAIPDSIVRPVVLLALVLVVAASGQLHPWQAMACHVAAATAAFAYACANLVALYRTGGFSLAFRREDFAFKAWFSSLLPLSMVTGVRVLNRRADIVMLGALGSVAAVAGYNLALQLTSIVLVAQTALNSYFSPKVADAMERGSDEEVQRLVAQSSLASTAFAAAAVAGFALVGYPIIQLIFGARYSEVYWIGLILSFGQLFSAVMGPTAMLLNMARLEKKALSTGLAAAALNIGLNAMLIPYLLAYGTAIATSLMLVFIQIQRWSMVRRHLGLRCDSLAALSILRSRT